MESPDGEANVQKRKPSRVACTACRARKAACDGSQPECGRCFKRGTKCVYTPGGRVAIQNEALTRENDALKTEVKRLQQEVQDLRSGSPATSQRDSASPIQKTSSTALTRTPGNFNPSPYPEHVEIQYLNSGKTPGDEFLFWHTAAYPPLFPFENAKDIGEAVLGQSSKKIDRLAVEEIESAWPNGPQHRFQPASYIDRLDDLDIQFWTDIPIANEYAATAIRMYLQTEHPVIARFDSSLFMRDLIDGRTDYCSSLLVNALICHALVRFAHVDSNALEHSYAFFCKARVLWDEKQHAPNILAVPALQLLIYAGAMHGLDAESQRFTTDCWELVKRWGLQDTLLKEPLRASNGANIPDDLRCRAHIAWGYFVSASLWAFAYRWQLPVPPTALPIPGSPGFALPPGMGESFTCICRFWTIVESAIVKYGNLDSHPEVRVPFYVAEDSYRRLLQWAHDLPPSCLVTDSSPHHVVVMHIWLHTAVIALTRPWTQICEAAPHGCELGDVHKASVRQLKRLVVGFLMRYPESRFHVYWHIALIYLANAVLTTSMDAEWQFYYLVCLKGYLNLSAVYGFAPICFKGLLTVAMEKGRMSAKQARRLLLQLAEKQLSRAVYGERSLGIRLVIADTSLADEDRSAERLAEGFERVALAQEGE